MWRSISILLCFALSLLPAAPAQAAERPPYFDTTPCPVSVPEGTVCGDLVVLEDRADPASRTIRVAVVILKAKSNTPQPDPIVYLEGGPGGSALESAGLWANHPLRQERDFILVEQRGTKYSHPFLDCPEITEQSIINFQRDLGFEAEIANEVEAAVRCRDRLIAAGADLSAYNSAAIAEDLKDLRQVLGIRQWNLYGISYGTRVALEAARTDPEGTRSMLLDSVYPPQYNSLVRPIPDAGEAFDRVFAACQTDAACSAAYPDLRRRFYALIERLDADPIQLQITRPDTGERLNLLMTGGDIANLLYFGLYSAEIISFVPLMVEELERGNNTILMPIMDMALQFFTMASANGMYLSVECYDRAGMDDPDLGAQLAAAYPALKHFTLFRGLRANCAIWGAGHPDPAQYLPVQSDIPTLLLSGELDPISPVEPAAETARFLPRSFHYIFPARSHAVSLHPCAEKIVLQFIEDPARQPDSSCISSMSGIRFYLPQQVHITPALYLLTQKVLAKNDPLILGSLALVCALMLVELLLWPLRLLRRRHPAVPLPRWSQWARLWGTLAALIHLAFLAGLVLAGFQTITSNSYMAAFGVPAEARLLFFLPWAAPILALGLAVFCISLWKTHTWKPTARLHYTLLTLSAASLCWGYLQLGLLR